MIKVQKGFTLIELMIVVAIIGILAAIAIPAYQNYTKRAHVSEGLNLAAASKLAVAEYYASNNSWPTNNDSAGLPVAESITGNAVKEVEVEESLITITYSTKVGTDSPTLELKGTSGSGGITWTCRAGTIDEQYLPSNCR